MDDLLNEIKSKKRIKTDKDWDLIDKKFKRSLFECYPKIKNQLSDLEKVIFWENAMGYVYVRYGSNLLKKYREIDMTLTKIRDNIFENKISIKPAVKRLCKEWPVLYGTSEDEISELFKDVFELKPKNKILPKGVVK